MPISQTIDHPDFVDGYKWTCCGNLGSERGCVKGPHEGKQAVNEDNIIEPDAKQRKVDGGKGHFGNVGTGPLVNNDMAPKAAAEKSVRVIKAPVIITVPDSCDTEGEK